MEANRGAGTWRRAAVEMLVIIFSVLIVLALDNWNEERKEAREEAEYLEGFVADLASDSLNLAQRISIAQRGEARRRCRAGHPDCRGRTHQLRRQESKLGRATA